MEDCKDQKLISGIENVLYDNVPTGKNNNFDVCVRDALPACPINAWHHKYGHSKDNEGDILNIRGYPMNKRMNFADGINRRRK